MTVCLGVGGCVCVCHWEQLRKGCDIDLVKQKRRISNEDEVCVSLLFRIVEKTNVFCNNAKPKP